MSDAYIIYLEERYQGEVYGEAIFDAWARATGDTAVAEKLQVLARLEREMGGRLAGELRALGRAPQADPGKREEGEKIGGALGGAAWPGVLDGFRSQLTPLVEEFERAESLAPEGKLSLLQDVTAHERALLLFADREGAGQADALEPALDLLRSWET